MNAIGQNDDLLTTEIDYSAMTCTERVLILSRYVCEGRENADVAVTSVLEMTAVDFESDSVCRHLCRDLIPISSMYVLRDRVLLIYVQKLGLGEYGGQAYVMDLTVALSGGGDDALKRMVEGRRSLFSKEESVTTEARASDATNYALEVISDTAVAVGIRAKSDESDETRTVLVTFGGGDDDLPLRDGGDNDVFLRASEEDDGGDGDALVEPRSRRSSSLANRCTVS